MPSLSQKVTILPGSRQCPRYTLNVYGNRGCWACLKQSIYQRADLFPSVGSCGSPLRFRWLACDNTQSTKFRTCFDPPIERTNIRICESFLDMTVEKHNAELRCLHPSGLKKHFHRSTRRFESRRRSVAQACGTPFRQYGPRFPGRTSSLSAPNSSDS